MLTYDHISHIASRPCVLALGCFDGVHMGHKEVLRTARDIANQKGLPLTVFTFTEPPRNFFSPVPVPVITSPEEKSRLFENEGVDTAFILPLSQDIFSISPKSFIDDVLIDKLGAVHLVCGFNYTFGAGGKGNTELLIGQCAKKSVGVSIVPEYRINGQAVSSSAIRQAVIDGNIDTATTLLGRPYSLTSVVVNGQHLARRLDFPTANIIPPSNALLPKNGVYATRIYIGGDRHNGITNVGMRPTVDTNILCAETHIFDFDGDIYGKQVTIEFIKFIRGETKFDGLDALSKQVQRDIKTAKDIFKR